MAKLGVVVPYYNQAETLWSSLSSLLESEIPKEIVIVDDGTWPPAFPLGVAKDLKYVKLIRLDPNQGVQFARNVGFYALQGLNCEYTLFSDSDVIWAPNALDKLVQAIKETGLGYAYCDYDKGFTGTWKAGPWSKKKLQKENFISTMSVIRTSALDALPGTVPFDQKIERLQDWDLWLELLKCGIEGAYVPEVLFRTEFKDGAISKRFEYQDAISAIKLKHNLP